MLKTFEQKCKCLSTSVWETLSLIIILANLKNIIICDPIRMQVSFQLSTFLSFLSCLTFLKLVWSPLLFRDIWTKMQILVKIWTLSLIIISNKDASFISTLDIRKLLLGTLRFCYILTMSIKPIIISRYLNKNANISLGNSLVDYFRWNQRNIILWDLINVNKYDTKGNQIKCWVKMGFWKRLNRQHHSDKLLRNFEGPKGLRSFVMRCWHHLRLLQSLEAFSWLDVNFDTVLTVWYPPETKTEIYFWHSSGFWQLKIETRISNYLLDFRETGNCFIYQLYFFMHSIQILQSSVSISGRGLQSKSPREAGTHESK